MTGDAPGGLARGPSAARFAELYWQGGSAGARRMAALPTRNGSGLTRTLGGYGALMVAKAELEHVKR